MPPQYVQPYVKRHKNDAADAEAICEAVTRPTMRFVPAKTAEQQGILMLHRTRELLVRQQTMTVNAMRAHLAEFGVVVAQGIQNADKISAIVGDENDSLIPGVARESLRELVAQYAALRKRIAELKAKIVKWHRSSEVSRRLATVPGIGPITASALAATVADPKQFHSARQFAAWLGLVPRQHSTGGKEMMGSISKRGNPYLRRLLVIAAQSVQRWKVRRLAEASEWLRGLMARRPHNVVATALAKQDRAPVVWAAECPRRGRYRAPAAAALPEMWRTSRAERAQTMGFGEGLSRTDGTGRDRDRQNLSGQGGPMSPEDSDEAPIRRNPSGPSGQIDRAYMAG